MRLSPCESKKEYPLHRFICPQNTETSLTSDISYCARFGVLFHPNRPGRTASILTTATAFLKTLLHIIPIKRIYTLRAELRRFHAFFQFPTAFVATIFQYACRLFSLCSSDRIYPCSQFHRNRSGLRIPKASGNRTPERICRRQWHRRSISTVHTFLSVVNI